MAGTTLTAPTAQTIQTEPQPEPQAELQSKSQPEREWSEAVSLLPRKRWTRRECRTLQDAGLLEAGRYELIAGEIVLKMPQGRLHVFVVMRLYDLLVRMFGEGRVQSQSSIPLDDENDPEPDVAVLRGTLADYLDREPGPSDALLIVEVANTTLRTDRAVKALLYARAGVEEYWIANIPERTLEVYREPGADGYRRVARYSVGESVAPLSASQAINIVDIFPPAESAPV